MFWDEKIECMPREELAEIQLKRLQDTVHNCYKNVPHYRKAFEEKGIKPEDIKSLEDLKKIPFTVKSDLRDNYPYGLFAVPLSEIVRIHSSSGTTGKPTVVAYTKNDINMWSGLMARCLSIAGATKDDIVHNAYGYGLFTGGLGMHYGGETVGAAVIPVSGGNTKRQLMIMQDYGSTVLACTPSYALNMAEAMREEGIKPEDMKLRIGIFGAEPWSAKMREEIEKQLGIIALDIYGLSEIMGPGVAMECPAKRGLHLAEDHFIAEIIDPMTEEVLPYGEKGELVITTLSKEALPMLRYRTRDITSLEAEKCSCGRTHLRIQKFQGRSDDMLIIRGVNVFPTQIESVLLKIGQLEPHYQIVVDRIGNLDTVEVLVEVSIDFFSDKVGSLESLEHRIKGEIESTLGVSVRVRLVEPKTIERSEGKAKRVIDKRKL